MENKRFWWGMLVMVLAFGMEVVGCNNGTTETEKDPGPGITGTIILSKIPVNPVPDRILIHAHGFKGDEAYPGDFGSHWIRYDYTGPNLSLSSGNKEISWSIPYADLRWGDHLNHDDTGREDFFPAKVEFSLLVFFGKGPLDENRGDYSIVLPPKNLSASDIRYSIDLGRVNLKPIPKELIGKWYENLLGGFAFEFTSDGRFISVDGKTSLGEVSVTGTKVTIDQQGIETGSFEFSIDSDGKMTLTNQTGGCSGYTQSPFVKK